jgi:arsenical pump membrane protein
VAPGTRRDHGGRRLGSPEASLEAGDGNGDDGGNEHAGTGGHQQPGEDDARRATHRRALRAFAPRLVLWAAVVAIVTGTDPDRALSLMLVALAGVVTIVTDARFPLERRLEDAGLPSREAWVPLLMLGLMLGLDLIDSGHIDDVLSEQGPVIVFILGFAVVSEGLRRCGFFHYLAYRLAERGGANTTRLTLYLFLLSSLLTYFTSNDIVILTMTPIVLAVVHQARIGNAKLLLLSQFVAANTVSMGLLIGSPTNLILGRAVELGFVEYLALMVVPSAMALMGTFVFVTWVNGFVERHGRRPGLVTRLIGSWRYSPVYSPPRFAEYRSFTPNMRRWVGLFALSVVMLAFGAATSTGLLVAAVVTATLGTVALRWDAHAHGRSESRRAFAGRTLRILPVGIVFFGLTYFVIADAIADTPFVEDDVHEFVLDHGSSHTPLPSWGAILGSGVLVNTMNDLPASALSGDVLANAEDGFETPFDRMLVAQGLLVGLNIATYVTPVGALAGIIWFDILRKDRERRRKDAAVTAAVPGRAGAARARPPLDIVMPERRDLVIYGAATFLAMTALLGATNFGFVALTDWLAGPPSGRSEFGQAPAHLAWTLAGLALMVAVLVQFRRVLRANGVALTHLGDLLLVLTRVRLLAAKHRVVTALVISLLVFLGSGFALYRVELFHADHYTAGGRWGGESQPPFDGPVDFIVWLYVFVSSGFEQQEFPQSILGHFIAGGLVLGSIAAVVVVLRLIFAGSNDFTLRRKMASGEIPTDRVVVVNATMGNLRLIRSLAAQPRRFVVIATRDDQLRRRLERHRNDRTTVIPFEDSARELVADLHLEDAREIVLLSRSVSEDFDNLDLLSTLDTVVGATGVAVVGPGDDDTSDQAVPAIFLQQHGRELPALVERRLGALGPVLVQLPFDDVVRSFLVADAAGRLDDLRRLYASPSVDPVELPDVDRHVRIEGLQLSLGVGPAPLPAASTPGSSSASVEVEVSTEVSTEVIGVQVDAGGRPEWQTLASGHADELTRPVTGSVVLGPAGTYPGEVGNGVRGAVHVVGCDALAQGCALDLAAAGVGRIELFVGPTDALVPGVAEASNPTVHRCRDELEVAETLGQDRPGSELGSGDDEIDEALDEAILVVECDDGDGFLTERLLERLSVARLHRMTTGRPVPPLYVCCRGPERARRARNFVVDEIIDATWVESSYFEVFSVVYFHVIPAHEAAADWPSALRMRVAHRIASRLCHLEVLHPDDLWTTEAGAVRRGAGPAISGLEAVRADRAASPARGPLVGVVRFSIEDGDDGEPLVLVEVEVPPTDRRLGATDLLVGVPCL